MLQTSLIILVCSDVILHIAHLIETLCLFRPWNSWFSCHLVCSFLGFPRWHSGKEPACNAGVIRDTDSIPGWGRSPGGGHGSPVQYSCLENPTDRGAWWATDHGVTKNQTQLKWLRIHAMQPWTFLSLFSFHPVFAKVNFMKRILPCTLDHWQHLPNY